MIAISKGPTSNSTVVLKVEWSGVGYHHGHERTYLLEAKCARDNGQLQKAPFRPTQYQILYCTVILCSLLVKESSQPLEAYCSVRELHVLHRAHLRGAEHGLVRSSGFVRWRALNEPPLFLVMLVSRCPLAEIELAMSRSHKQSSS